MIRSENLLIKAEKLKKFLIFIRRRIHKNPELSFREKETAKIIAKQLQCLGLKVKEKVAETGLVGILKGTNKSERLNEDKSLSKRGKCLLLRADMDALPIEEKTGFSYKSKISGRMHACGHDAHCAILLGTAYLLSEIKDLWSGTVKFVFQPGEETPPGGAQLMIKEGILERPKIDAAFALHLDPEIPLGKIGLKPHTLMGAADNIKIIIIGKGGHAAQPHKSVDTVVIAAQVIQALQTIVSRKVNPLSPVVITIGTIQGGYRSNIIADKVEMEGTVRTIEPAVREKMPQMIEKIIAGITRASDAKYELQYLWGYPPLFNDLKMIDLARQSAISLFGKKAILEIVYPLMGAEDFTYFLQKVPGALLRLGTRNKAKGVIYPWHHPKFNIDEDVLPIGAALLAKIALDYLK
ncbi:MAG: amidohydrolase [Candidatus Edwardsbacteria bacterium]